VKNRVASLGAKYRNKTNGLQEGLPACVLTKPTLVWIAQPGVAHVLAGGRNLAQVTENAQAGELNLEAADLARLRKDVIALGEPVKG